MNRHKYKFETHFTFILHLYKYVSTIVVKYCLMLNEVKCLRTAHWYTFSRSYLNSSMTLYAVFNVNIL